LPAGLNKSKLQRQKDIAALDQTIMPERPDDGDKKTWSKKFTVCFIAQAADEERHGLSSKQAALNGVIGGRNRRKP
jgi:hypothetical protein